MILNYEYCNNEKYYNSIRYFYHLEESEERKDRILEMLIGHNVVLAASCIVTDKINKERETKLIDYLVPKAKDFSDEKKSIMSLLALSELKQHSIILNIFNEIPKPQTIHRQVLRKIFQQADENVFLNFITSFTDYQFFNVISTEFLYYPKKIIPSKESVEILKKFIIFLNEIGLIGFIRLFLEKYDLLGHAGYFYSEAIEKLILNLLSGTKKEVFLGYSILIYNNYSEKIGANRIITLLSQTKDKKTIKLAIDFALKTSTFDNPSLNERLKGLISSGKKQSLSKLIFWLKNGLFDYCKNVPELGLQLTQQTTDLGIRLDKFEITKINKDSTSRDENIQNLIDQFNSLEGFDKFINELSNPIVKNFETQDTLELFWYRYFINNNPSLKNIPIEVFIERSLSLFGKDLREICQALKKFEIKGIIVKKSDHGYYIRSSDFRSFKTLFLHPQQCPKNFSDIEPNNEIIFKIIGYNYKTKRINIELKNVVVNTNIHQSAFFL